MANTSIIQWNCRGIKPNFNEVKILADQHKAVLLCLQETFLNDTDYTIRGFSCYNKICHDVGGRACGGVSVLVRDGATHGHITLNTTLQAEAVTVTSGKVFTVCSLYLPPSEPLDVPALEQLITQLPSPYMLLGDFNAHNVVWGSDSNNNKGNVIYKFISDNNLCLMNDGSYTYLHSGSGTFTAIDLSLCTPGIFMDLDFEVESDTYGSDHFPIVLRCGGAAPESVPRWNLNRAEWNDFRELCLSEIKIDVFQSQDEPMSIFTRMLFNIAKATIPRSTTKQRKLCKSWFNVACKEAIRKRKKALNVYRKYPTQRNLDLFRISRGVARKVIRTSKRDSWHKYVSRINLRRTTLTSVWTMTRKIVGKYRPSIVSHLQTGGNKIQTLDGIADTLASSFAFNSSSENCTPAFKKHKLIAEKKTLSFSSDNSEYYNEEFSLTELKHALEKSRDTSPGLDLIHYQILKHLPDESLSVLLTIFNYIWQTQDFPTIWKTALIIPIQKPGKIASDPKSYRPISLTSCICKTFERMVNRRLVWYIERNQILTAFQSGFRKQRSTTDHLVRLESFIRESFILNQHVISVFFDLEKAYDTTWKYGIMKDLYDAGLRGHLPLLIQNFLSDRSFRVRVGNTYSNVYSQEMGVPQGSILSVTLFSIKINSIVKRLPFGMQCSLYVDDFVISYSSPYLNTAERSVQQCLNSLQQWSNENGFKFSKTKTVCVHFCRQRRLHPDPTLYLDGSQIPVLEETKFLGLIFDRKLNFKSHILKLKTECAKALNLLIVLSNTDWGSDRQTLLLLYRSLVRSKLDFGCIVYGESYQSYVKMLDPIHNKGLRLCLGAFRASPVDSLYVEANEPPLHIRRIKLALQYSNQLMSNESNPAYSCVFSPSYTELFDRKPRSIKPIGMRLREHIDNVGFDPEDIEQFVYSRVPPWKYIMPITCFDLSQHKKSETDPIVFRTHFLSLAEHLDDHVHIYTDGSKDGDRTACAVVTPSFEFSKRLPDRSSIFSAELQALVSALRYCKINTSNKFAIFCDSKSVLQALSTKWDHPYVVIILEQLLHLYKKGKSVIFCWLPSHIGIRGNEHADSSAKAALGKEISFVKLPYKDVRQYIGKYVTGLWQMDWDQEVNNKLHSIKPKLGDLASAYRSVRRDEVLLCRLRIGHTRLTHSFLFNDEDPPECDTCQCIITVKHILLNCTKYTAFRQELFKDYTTLHDIFDKVDHNKIILFIQRAGLYKLL